MLKSMTGYGNQVVEENNLRVTVEVKTLNSKNFDPIIRIPKKYAEKEPLVRKAILDTLERGKIVLSLDIANGQSAEAEVSFNQELIQKYYKELKSIADSVNADDKDLMRTVLHLPNVMTPIDSTDTIEEEWKAIDKAVIGALEACDTFRKAEGVQLQKKLISYIENIRERLEEVIARDPERIKHIEEKIKKAFEEKALEVDQTRFEQELIYYIEKLDIEEEKTRLTTHLNFFLETINLGKKGVGKKLGFISQEIGREINTIGSKANDAVVQKLVVAMKDELEKIKEQTLNIL